MSSSPIKVQWSGHTDVGRYRKENQDRFISLKIDSKNIYHLGKSGEDLLINNSFIFAVSDGMGGANAGEYASRAVIEQITFLLPKFINKKIYGIKNNIKSVLLELLLNVHNSITKLSKAYPDLSGMGATLSLCWLFNNKLYYAHIGDSKIYHLNKKGEFKQITRDDTYIQSLIDKGTITIYEAKEHQNRNLLQQVLGGKIDKIDPQLGNIQLNNGDRLLICSDGLSEGLVDSSLKRYLQYCPILIQEGNTLAKKMVDDSVRLDGKDNSTAICLEIN